MYLATSKPICGFMNWFNSIKNAWSVQMNPRSCVFLSVNLMRKMLETRTGPRAASPFGASEK